MVTQSFKTVNQLVVFLYSHCSISLKAWNKDYNKIQVHNIFTGFPRWLKKKTLIFYLFSSLRVLFWYTKPLNWRKPFQTYEKLTCATCGNDVLCIVQFNACLRISKTLKQLSRGVLRKKYSENICSENTHAEIQF